MGRNKKYNEIIIDGEIAEIKIISKRHGVHYAIIDSKNIDKIKDYCWSVSCEYNKVRCYTRLFGSDKRKKNTFLHRLIMNPPDNMVVDHINHNQLDNREINLRVCTQKQNKENLRGCLKNSKSGIRGVSWHKASNKWVAEIRNNYKLIRLGYFVNIKDAENAVVNARKNIFTHSKECK